MSQVAIRVEGLGKRYRLGQQVGYKTLRETFFLAYHTPTRVIGERLLRMRHAPPATSHEPNHIWALKDVSFEVKPGEAVGIIGRNGSGKSTLLKVLSRITAPTEGYAEIHGRVGSLLEVGTGFHPELTGRENIYLNGATIGMKKAEIEGRFEEIVAFAEIEKFLDTPVKRYSSGMYVRLAFAVSAHLEPEVLVVDEVLAVGDAQFQKKCLGKMADIAGQGRTVLFVSHNMAAVNALCQRCVLLEKGQILASGGVKEVAGHYLSQQCGKSDADIDLTPPGLRRNSLEGSLFKWTHVKVVNSRGMPTTSIELMEPFDIIMTGILKQPVNDLTFGFGVMSTMGFSLFNSHTTDTDLPKSYPAGEIGFRVSFAQNILGPGMYTIDLGAHGPAVVDWIPEAVRVNIEPVSRDERISLRANYDGVVIYPCKWHVVH